MNCYLHHSYLLLLLNVHRAQYRVRNPLRFSEEENKMERAISTSTWRPEYTVRCRFYDHILEEENIWDHRATLWRKPSFWKETVTRLKNGDNWPRLPSTLKESRQMPIFAEAQFLPPLSEDKLPNSGCLGLSSRLSGDLTSLNVNVASASEEHMISEKERQLCPIIGGRWALRGPWIDTGRAWILNYFVQVRPRIK